MLKPEGGGEDGIDALLKHEGLSLPFDVIAT